ncbi:MAG: adenylate/guanylate cyclase domain-containing protein [Thermoleophilia bacterium]|nr:adenylate/guanylate cyclase domain-containing protein [Thermoleophilia bacterium]
MERPLPSGTVTFLFTDVEGSTKLLHELGDDVYAQALADHRLILRAAFSAHGGVEVDTQGDAFFVAFPTAPGALRAAADSMEGLASGPICVRVGIHTGTPLLTDEGYVGVDVHRAARIAASGHGGQVLVSSSAAPLIGTGELRDLGEHRLKDLSAPERIYQLGGKDFLPLKSLYRTNLPIPATPFLGRENELAEVLRLLEDARLLTLTGPGGTGKTRLGLQAAAEAAEHYPDGIFWVPLAPLRDPELVLATAGQALGAEDGLAAHLADKSLLLLFDNFEHVVEAATGLSELLASCPNLHLLVTSRELLRVPGEQVYPVSPLEPKDGTELFLARARAVLPSFVASDAVAELCTRLENLPLALELAAARARVLSPEQLLERLSQRLDLLKAGRGVDPRQQTLRATIEWSHELLDADEQQLFARLAVFVGGCTLKTAEAVCDADLDILESLVDKSLVRVREGNRFWMLETIREYAVERLEDSGEAPDLGRRHAEHFLALGEEAEPYTHRVDATWLDRLDREADNLRAALDWFEAFEETQLVLRLAGALMDYWGAKGYLAEGHRRLEDALAADDSPTAARAKALNAAADMQIGQGDAARARLRAEQGLALHRQLGNTWGVAASLFLLGSCEADDQEFERARQLWEESAHLFHQAGDSFQTLLATRMLAWAYDELGESDRARGLIEDVLEQARATGDKHLQVHALESLAHTAAPEGRLEEAAALLREAYELNRDLGDRFRQAILVCRFARVLAFAGRAGTAAKVLASGETLHEEMGASPMGWLRRGNDQALTLIHAGLDEAAFAEAWEQGRKLTADEAVALALDSLD